MNMFRQVFVTKDLLSFLHTGLTETVISNDQFERGEKSWISDFYAPAICKLLQ